MNISTIITSRAKAIILLGFCFLFAVQTKAQFSTAAAYPFTSSVKTYTYLSGGTAVPFPGSNMDDNIAGVPIGFSFPFCGNNYSTAYVTTNGHISFNSGASAYNNFNSSNPTSSMLPFVAPLWDDLSSYPTGSVTYLTSGTAPDRIFTVEWKEASWYYTGSPHATLSFQVKLYEQGVIEFLYTPESGGLYNASNCSATIGIINSASDYQTLSNSSTSPTSSSTSFTVNINSVPTAGQSYLWGEVPCDGTPSSEVVGVSPTCKGKSFGLSLTNVSIYSGLTFQWQKSLDSISWSNITGATTRSLTDIIMVPTYYRAIITCTNSNQTYTTAGLLIDTANYYLCYCATSTGSAGPTDVGNVRLISYPSGDTLLDNGSPLPTFNNSSANKGYSDFRRILEPTPMYADTQYRVLVSQISSNATLPSSRAAVYLDYNRNGRFDPMERLLLASTSITPPFPGMVTDTFAITVPADSIHWHGITGMRVILAAGATDPDTCMAYGDGETEDYLVDLRFPPCDGIPNAGVIEGDTSMCIGYDYTLIDSTYQKRKHGLSRVWEESADNISWNEIAGSLDKDTLNRMFTGQPKYYRVKMRCSHTGDSAYTAVHKVNVKASYKCYCHSQSMGGAEDSSDVGGFTLEDFSYNYGGSHLENPRSWHKRQDFTDWAEIEMFVDSIYEFSVFHTQINKNHGDAKITVFVDFNNNKLYDIPEERIYTGFTSVGNFNRMGQVIIPNTVITNVPTGMRVIINNDVSPNVPSDEACGEYVSGETEDYIVKFVRRFPSSVNEIGSVNNVSLYPNPTSGKFTVGFNSLKAGVVKVKVSSVTGQHLLQEVYNETAGNHSHELDLGGRAAGIYFVELEADGIKTTSRIVLK